MTSTRWLLSKEDGLDACDMEARAVQLDPWGEVPALAELVGLFTNRTTAAAAITGKSGREAMQEEPCQRLNFWRIGHWQGWDTWTQAEPTGLTWTRWRLLPFEPVLDVSPVPPLMDPAEVMLEREYAGLPLDALTAALAFDADATRKAVLLHGRSLAQAEGDAELVARCDAELHDLELESR